MYRFQYFFALSKQEKCTKQGMHLLTYYFKNVANKVITVSLFAGPVCCEQRHRRVEAWSSVGLCRR